VKWFGLLFGWLLELMELLEFGFGLSGGVQFENSEATAHFRGKTSQQRLIFKSTLQSNDFF
jgi:hypothetical protein